MPTRHRSWMVIGTAVLVVMLVAVAVGRRDGDVREEPTNRIVVVDTIDRSDPPVAVREIVEVPAPEDPNEVDRFVRAAVVELSHHPEFAGWIVTDGLARRIVAAVEAVADGYSPREELVFARPTTPLFIRYEGVQAVITDASFRRYDLAADVVASIDPADLVEVYRMVRPKLEVVHDRLPYTRGEFHARVLEAIDHLVEVAVPDGPYAVMRQTRTWAFADAELEGLSDAQRHLLRMGPRNARSIQASLRRFREVLEAPSRGDGTVDPAPVAVRSAYQEGSEASRSSTP